MQIEIPSAEEVRAALAGLSFGQMQELSRLSGVAFTTLWKVRNGETVNPRLESVRAFIGHIKAAAQFNAEAPSTPEPAKV